MDEDEFEALEEEGVVWRSVPGFPDYEASSQGEVVSWRDPESRKVEPLKGRTKFFLADGSYTSHTIGQMVAMAFLTPRPEGQRLRYVDGNPFNCAVPNLRWESPAEQAERTLGARNQAMREQTHCFRGHPLSGENLRRSKKNERICVTCHRASWVAAHRRRAQRAAGETGTWTTEDVLLERGQITFDALLSIM